MCDYHRCFCLFLGGHTQSVLLGMYLGMELLNHRKGMFGFSEYLDFILKVAFVLFYRKSILARLEASERCSVLVTPTQLKNEV